MYKNLLIAKQFFFSFSSKGEEIYTISKAKVTFNSGRWLNEEHTKFIEGIFLYGNEWRKVERYIKTRSAAQARSHAQKFFINIQKKFIDENVSVISKCQNSEEDNGELMELLLKFTILHLNCDSVEKFYSDNENLNEEYDCDYYTNENKYKFMLCLQKIKNAYDNTNSTNNYNSNSSKSFLVYQKEKFARLLLNLLHSTRVHNRKLSLLEISISSSNSSTMDNVSKLLSTLSSSPTSVYEFEKLPLLKTKGNSSNPFNLGNFSNGNLNLNNSTILQGDTFPNEENLFDYTSIFSSL